MAQPGYLLKAPEADLSRWKAAARDQGQSFAEFIRGALNAASGGEEPQRPARSSAKRNAASPQDSSKKRRTELCRHRRTPEQYCSRCDI